MHLWHHNMTAVPLTRASGRRHATSVSSASYTSSFQVSLVPYTVNGCHIAGVPLPGDIAIAAAPLILSMSITYTSLQPWSTGCYGRSCEVTMAAAGVAWLQVHGATPPEQRHPPHAARGAAGVPHRSVPRSSV